MENFQSDSMVHGTVWEEKKEELLRGIDLTLQKEGVIDKEVLEIMKELVNHVKVKVRMEDYLNTKLKE